MVGEECTELRQMLDVSYPMENGVVRSWEDMGHIYDYTFGPEKLDIDPQVRASFFVIHVRDKKLYFCFRTVNYC